MKLISPSPEFEQSWKEALDEFEAEDVGGFWLVPHPPKNIADYIQISKDFSEGKNLPKYWVPATTFWLIEKGRFIGHCNIRHQLNKALNERGGHIGFAIRKSEREKGYGRKILELALEKSKILGLDKVLVTCDDTNQASRKIIEGNSGQLEKIIDLKGNKIRHYWIDLN